MHSFRSSLYTTVLVFVAAAVLFGCGNQKMEIENTVSKAIAVLHPTQGNTAMGVITFTQTENGVRVEAEIENITSGKHGFHIHEFGDCSDLNGKSAGGHFNPQGKKHGGPDAAEHHLGDLGNITADENGHAQLNRVFSFLSLNGVNSIIGRGVILHAKADDLTSQPTGAAGARLACGVIGVAKSQ